METFGALNLSFIQKGSGEDLVFLHGYLSSKEAFTSQIEYFSRFYRVTALDFPGFGNAEPLTEPFSVLDYAAWLKRALEQLGVKTPLVIAHSFGCRVAVKAASLYPNLFKKLLLTGAAGVIMNRGFSYRIKVKAYRVCRAIFPVFAERKFGSKEYRSLSPVMKESYKKIVNEDLRSCAKNVRCSVMIVQGETDTTTPLCEAQAYLESFPNAKLKIVAGGHFSFAEYPTAFNLISEEFFYG